MEFLENFVIPQSSEHIELLHYLTILIFILFVPFISMVLGGISLSIFYKHKGIKENNSSYIQFAKEIIEIVTVNKSLGVILGIVPLLTAVLIYAQLLQLGNTLAVSYLSISFLITTFSLILVYTYRYSTKFSILFGTIDKIKTEDPTLSSEITELSDASRNLSLKTGYYGLGLLFVAIWIFISGVSIASFPQEWTENHFFSILFSWTVIVRFLFFIAMAFAFTGGTILFQYFYWEGGKKNLKPEYKDFVRKIGINLTLYSSLFLPIFLAFILFALPDASISGAIFGYSTLALVLMFLCYHLLYSMLKQRNTNYSGLLYIMLVLILASVIIKDQLAMVNATKDQSKKLSANFEKYLAGLQGEKVGEKISGEEIYQRICISCHRFDVKVVGPPYDSTMPKYEGKINRLIAFIRNPVKVNPAYPPMPNPGLKPNEAEAVATYLLENYKKK
jgi:cytochrome c